MSILPDDYKVPSTSKYMKFKQGPNRFRILSERMITGWEYWTEEGGKRKPNRVKDQVDLPDDAEAKHFWAMAVWNWDEGAVQVLQVTQKTIMSSLMGLFDSKAWGEPRGYNIVVTRAGEGFDTEYAVMPEPKEAINIPGATDKGVNLEALYEGGDPFADKQAEENEQIIEEVENADTKLSEKEKNDIIDELMK